MRYLTAVVFACLNAFALGAEPGPLEWPPITRECRPQTYWWWMGSAVDQIGRASCRERV